MSISLAPKQQHSKMAIYCSIALTISHLISVCAIFVVIEWRAYSQCSVCVIPLDIFFILLIGIWTLISAFVWKVLWGRWKDLCFLQGVVALYTFSYLILILIFTFRMYAI